MNFRRWFPPRQTSGISARGRPAVPRNQHRQCEDLTARYTVPPSGLIASLAPRYGAITNSKQGDHDESGKTWVDGISVLAWVESSATARRLEVDAGFQELFGHRVDPGISWRDGRAVCARTCALDRCHRYRFLACDSAVVVTQDGQNQPTFGVRTGHPFDHDPEWIDFVDLDAGGRVAGGDLVWNCRHASAFASISGRRGSVALNLDDGNGHDILSLSV
jgi:hypothetical protein